MCLSSSATNLLTILFRLLQLYSAYSVLTLYKCKFHVLQFQSFAFMDVVILVFDRKKFCLLGLHIANGFHTDELSQYSC